MTARKKPIQKDPVNVEPISGPKLAELLGITARQVSQLVTNGVLTPTLLPRDGTSGPRTRKFIPSVAVQEYIAYKIKAEISAGRGPKVAGTVGAKTTEELDVRIKELTAALRAEQVENQKQKNLLNSGALIYASAVSEELAVFFGALKRYLLSVPSRVVAMISGLLDPLEIRRISQELHKEICTQMEAFVVSGVLIDKEADAGGDD